MKEKVLLFNFRDESRLKAVRTALFLSQTPVRMVAREEYGVPLRDLLEAEQVPFVGSGRELDDCMMVFAGIREDKLDRILSLLRSNPACGEIPCKAVLTERNQNWNAWELFGELKKEHEAMRGR